MKMMGQAGEFPKEVEAREQSQPLSQQNSSTASTHRGIKANHMGQPTVNSGDEVDTMLSR
jgi:hypothetical protein